MKTHTETMITTTTISIIPMFVTVLLRCECWECRLYRSRAVEDILVKDMLLTS